MSPGTLGQFLLYAVFAAGASARLSEVWGELQQAAGAAERLSRTSRRGARHRLAGKPVAAAAAAGGRHPLRQVSSSPIRPAPDTARSRGSSFHVRPGETVAVVGASGAGKSDALRAAVAPVRPTGAAFWSTASMSATPRGRGARPFAIVPQDVTIFAGSVADNIAFGKPGASQADIEAAPAQPRRTTSSGAADGYDDPGRRTRHDAFRRPAPAHRHRPRHPARRADPAARRGDIGARRRKRDAGAKGA
jgi:ATP-binding cassette subfamily B protein